MRRRKRIGKKSQGLTGRTARSRTSAKTSTPLPDPDEFAVRYAQNYKAIVRLCHKSTNGVCCLCRSRRSEEAHHVCYSDRHGAIAGREVPGIHLFPLCERCHNTAHKKENWLREKGEKAILGNRNTTAFVEKLKFGYQLLQQGQLTR